MITTTILLPTARLNLNTAEATAAVVVVMADLEDTTPLRRLNLSTALPQAATDLQLLPTGVMALLSLSTAVLLNTAVTALINPRLSMEDMDHLSLNTAATRTNILLPAALPRATTHLLRTILLRV